MPISTELYDKIEEHKKNGYSPDEILQGIAASNKYPDVVKKMQEYQKDYSSDEILEGLRSSVEKAPSPFDVPKAPHAGMERFRGPVPGTPNAPKNIMYESKEVEVPLSIWNDPREMQKLYKESIDKGVSPNFVVKHKKRGPLTGVVEYGTDVLTGALQVWEGGSRYGERLGIPGFKESGDFIEKQTKALQYYSTPPDKRGMLQDLAGGAGSMFSLMGPAMATRAVVLKMASNYPKLAKTAAWVTASGLESAVEGGTVYKEMKDRGASEEEAKRASDATLGLNAVLIGVTNKLGIFGERGKEYRRHLYSALMEGLQETGQSAISDVTKDDPVNWNDALYSGLIGSILGGGVSVVLNDRLNEVSKLPDLTKNDKLNLDLIKEDLESGDLESIAKAQEAFSNIMERARGNEASKRSVTRMEEKFFQESQNMIREWEESFPSRYEAAEEIARFEEKRQEDMSPEELAEVQDRARQMGRSPEELRKDVTVKPKETSAEIKSKAMVIEAQRELQSLTSERHGIGKRFAEEERNDKWHKLLGEKDQQLKSTIYAEKLKEDLRSQDYSAELLAKVAEENAKIARSMANYDKMKQDALDLAKKEADKLKSIQEKMRLDEKIGEGKNHAKFMAEEIKQTEELKKAQEFVDAIKGYETKVKEIKKAKVEAEAKEAGIRSKEELDKIGVEFIGMQELADGSKLPFYTDKETKSSFILEKGQDLKERVDILRESFKKERSIPEQKEKAEPKTEKKEEVKKKEVSGEPSFSGATVTLITKPKGESAEVARSPEYTIKDKEDLKVLVEKAVSRNERFKGGKVNIVDTKGVSKEYLIDDILKVEKEEVKKAFDLKEFISKEEDIDEEQFDYIFDVESINRDQKLLSEALKDDIVSPEELENIKVNPELYKRSGVPAIKGFVEASKALDKITRGDELSKWAEKHGTVPQKMLMRILNRYGAEKFLKNVKVEIVDKGISKYSEGTITISKDDNIQTVPHEILHAITSAEYNKKGEFARNVNQLMAEVQSKLSDPQKKALVELQREASVIGDKTMRRSEKLAMAYDKIYGDKEGPLSLEAAYAFENGHEFISQSYTSPSMQELLRGIKLQESKGVWKSAMQAFTRMVSKHFGGDGMSKSVYQDMFDKVIDVTGRGIEDILRPKDVFSTLTLNYFKKNWPEARPLSQKEALHLVERWEKKGSINLDDVPGLKEFIGKNKELSKSDVLNYVRENQIKFEVKEFGGEVVERLFDEAAVEFTPQLISDLTTKTIPTRGAKFLDQIKKEKPIEEVVANVKALREWITAFENRLAASEISKDKIRSIHEALNTPREDLTSEEIRMVDEYMTPDEYLQIRGVKKKDVQDTTKKFNEGLELRDKEGKPFPVEVYDAFNNLGRSIYDAGVTSREEWISRMKETTGAYMKDWDSQEDWFKNLYSAVSATHSTISDEAVNTFAKEKKKGHGFKNSLEDALGVVSTELRHYHPEILKRARRWVQDTNLALIKDTKNITPFIEAARKLPEETQFQLTMALRNKDTNTAERLAKDNGLYPDYIRALSVLNDIWTRAQESGIGGKTLEKYWPSKVKDYDGLMAALEGTGIRTMLDEAIYKIEKESKSTLLNEERGAILDKLLRGYQQGKITLTDPRYAKARTIGKVTPELNQFYAPLHESLLDYVQVMNRQIENNKFFGKGSLSSADKVLKEIVGDEEFHSMVKTDSDLKDSIGTLIYRLKKDGLITTTDQEFRLKKTLHVIFNPARTSAWVSGVINTTTGAMLSNLGSVLVQIQDMALAAEQAGRVRSVIGASKSLMGKSEVTLEDIGFDAHVRELITDISNQGRSAFVVNEVMKWTGMNKIEKTTSEAAINGTLNRYRALANSNPAKMEKMLKDNYGFNSEEIAGIMEDLRTGEVSTDIKLLLFQVLSDIKPMSLLEVPKKYLQSNELKLLYSLKKYQIKLMDVYRRDVYDEFKSGNKVEATRKLLRLTTSLVLLGMGVDALKDLLFNRPVDDVDDYLVENLWKIVGMTKYTGLMAVREGFGSTLVNIMAPPSASIGNDIGKDLQRLLKEQEEEKGVEVTKYIPFVGKFWYAWGGEGARKMEAGVYDKKED